MAKHEVSLFFSCCCTGVKSSLSHVVGRDGHVLQEKLEAELSELCNLQVDLTV